MKNLLKVQIASRRQVKYYLVQTLLFSSSHDDAGFSTSPEKSSCIGSFLELWLALQKMSYFLIEPTKFLNCSSKLSLKPFLFLGQHQLLQFSLSATADKKARPTFLMVIMRESSLYHELFLKREQTPAPSSLMHHCGLNF